MTCQDVRKMLNAFVDHELPAAKHERVTAHLAQCEACRETAARLETMAVLIGEARGPELPEGLSRRILVQARARLSEQPSRAAAFFRWWNAEPSLVRAAGVAAVCAGLLLGLLLGADLWAEKNGSEMVVNTAVADPVAIYQLNYFGGAPSGSLEQAFLGPPPAPGEKR